MSIGILFTHHNANDVTSFNFNRLKQFNPDKDIYPVGFKDMNLLPNSFVVDEGQEYLPKNFLFAELTKLNRHWTQADLLIYDFVLHNDLPHDKYLIIEWDTYCNCSIEDFFGDALNKESFGNIVHDPIQENWNWYNCLTDEQKSNISVFGGYTPTTGLLFSKELILKINQHLISNLRKYDNIFSELRLGSLVKIVGGSLDVPFNESYKFMNWNSDKIIFDKTKNGYYHPVKTIVT